MALAEKIKCNKVEPSKSEVYALAAELVEQDNIIGFRAAIIESLKSYDYYYYHHGYDYYYYHDGYDYYYHRDGYDYYGYDYYGYDYYYYYSTKEKVIALLFLAAMYS